MRRSVVESGCLELGKLEGVVHGDTFEVLAHTETDGTVTVDKILDTVGQKEQENGRPFLP